MDWYNALLVVHILAVSLWIGGGAAAVLIGSVLRARSQVAAFAGFCGALEKLGGPMFGGAGGITLLTGIGMVAKHGGPRFQDAWVSVGMAGWLVTTIFGAVVVGRAWSALGKDLAAPGAELEPVRQRINRAVTWTWVDLAFRAAIVAVMVFKPT
jgi:hypothetical protein